MTTQEKVALEALTGRLEVALAAHSGPVEVSRGDVIMVIARLREMAAPKAGITHARTPFRGQLER